MERDVRSRSTKHNKLLGQVAFVLVPGCFRDGRYFLLSCCRKVTCIVVVYIESREEESCEVR
jgi:hypothetical protein